MVSNVGRSLEDYTVPTSQRAASPDLGQQDFLKLMVEQMRNQNPLEPQDNSEFFSQIAQFQTLDAMNMISKAITTLVEVSGLSNASALIGKSITAEVAQSADPVTGFPRPPEEVTGVVERVTFDSNGAVLHVGNRAIPASAVTEIADGPAAPAAPPTTATDVTAEILAQLLAAGAFGVIDPSAPAAEGDGSTDPDPDAASEVDPTSEVEPESETGTA
jgi:flagellar basal-body rod modification protein FlgD